jgi:NAD+ synthase
MANAATRLKIKEEETIARIEQYLRNLCKEKGTSGLLVGLSGGVDSALLAALAVRALGSERVRVSYLYDRDSEQDSSVKAHLVANWLNLELEVASIEQAMREKRIYKPFIMQVSSLSPWINQHLINNAYRFVFGEIPFVSTLRQGRFERPSMKALVYNLTIQHIEAGFNARHRYRRTLLEQKSVNEHLVLVGAANRSEFLLGWFVKDGIDDLPIQPLAGLYKTQIRQLAKALSVPDAVLGQPASPDMILGITDEYAINMSYGTADLILDIIDRGSNDEDMASMGLDLNDVYRVREIVHLSTWKRASTHFPPPVDGTVAGGLRISTA